MTVASRRFAHRCRERLATDPTSQPTAPPTTAEPNNAAPATTDSLEPAAATPQENVDATS